MLTNPRKTKAQDNLTADNVKLKQLATVDWTGRVNQLNPDDRMGVTWEYVLLGEQTFNAMVEKGATLSEICEYVKITRSKVEETLF